MADTDRHALPGDGAARIDFSGESAEELYENAPCGYLSMALDGRILRVNRTLAGWLGQDRDTLLAHRFQDLVTVGARIFFDTHYAPLLLIQDFVHEIAMDMRDANGQTIPVLINSALQRDAAGKPALIRLSIFNANERRRYERELLHAKRQAEEASRLLEQRVAERTRELVDALARAQAGAQAKNALLAAVSHEMRTPLHAILGLAQLALERDASPAVQGYLERIAASGQQMMRIVSDILDVAKMESGKLELVEAPFGIADAVREAVATALPLAQRKGLALRMDIDPALPRLSQGDRGRLLQILGNYLDNAIKFTASGAIEVHAHAVSGDASGLLLRMEVRDSGIGLSAAQCARLFQPFSQADASTTREYGGTGLGLAICRQLAELMGGRVGLDSEPGRGSLFWAELRLRHANDVQPAPETLAPVGQIEAARALLAGARVLVVEDNVLNQDLAREFLSSGGAIVSVAGNGRDALALLEQENVDCVLMDLQMPLMDGCEATRRMRADARWAKLPVIAMTANAMASDRDRCFACGMDDFLAKPVDRLALIDAVARQLARGVALAQPEPGAAAASSGAPGDQAPLLDLRMLADSLGQDAQKIRRFVGLFMSNAEKTVEEIGAALSARDTQAAAALGHRLKSSARALGAQAFAGLCQQLEQGGDDVEGMEQTLAAMRRMLPDMARETERS
ncbi:PAS domain-containing hybrid sensor histidine kinase/response regulator [Noviherbaspirillum pedocola]|uniref:Virulence sensor protein BvgS n=1 Tax=Noviherbaspirillum pedocola TaxID=2801341 RepID=A0A934W404_9BURK|nr:PAS domain-containing hybrid sensor histidine kinase/response regulator [Noviherbaspirillum pedocola]MBK4737996.1 response regulator [Noviherbaspirillum pedocola]